MLIVSKFHDYYDTVRSFGVDKTVVYQRKTAAVRVDDLFNGNEEFVWDKKGCHHAHKFETFTIGFCGKLYPLVRLHETVTTYGVPKTLVDRYTFFHDPYSVLARITDLGIQEREAWRGRFFSRHCYVNSLQDMKAFFDVKTWQRFEPEFQKHKCPVFILGEFNPEHYEIESRRSEIPLLVTNPRLEDYHFQAIKDPVTAFQEIYMYISGVLGVPSRPMVEIADKYKAARHGHDGKYSFRKPPETG